MSQKLAHRVALAFVALLILPILVACGIGKNATPSPTASPAPTLSLDAVSGPCVTSLPITYSLRKPYDERIPTASIIGTPTDAPAYSIINDKIQALRDILATVSNYNEFDAKQTEISMARQEVKDAWKDIEGKTVKEWQGWVIATGKEAIVRSGEMFLKTANTPLNRDHVVLISLIDPYEGIGPIAGKGFALRAPEPVIVIDTPTTTDDKTMCLGQKVTFTGVVDKANTEDTFDAFLSAAKVTITEDKLGGLKPFSGMEGVVVEFSRSMCFGSCPDYNVTAYSNGVVFFHGTYSTAVEGFRISTVDHARIQKLLDTLDQANFNSISSYTKVDVTDGPYFNITLIKGTAIHSMTHYTGDRSAPESLRPLEDSIDEILNTAPWVKER